MNTLRHLACLALLLPACLGPRAVDSDVPEDIEQVIFYHYPAALDATSTASTSAPSDEPSPEDHGDEAVEFEPEPVAASPMEAADAEPTESPATRDDEPSPTPAPSDAPEPAPSPEALDDEPTEPEPTEAEPELLELGDECSDDAECASGICFPVYLLVPGTPTGYYSQDEFRCAIRRR